MKTPSKPNAIANAIVAGLGLLVAFRRPATETGRVIEEAYKDLVHMKKAAAERTRSRYGLRMWRVSGRECFTAKGITGQSLYITAGSRSVRLETGTRDFDGRQGGLGPRPIQNS